MGPLRKYAESFSSWISSRTVTENCPLRTTTVPLLRRSSYNGSTAVRRLLPGCDVFGSLSASGSSCCRLRLDESSCEAIPHSIQGERSGALRRAIKAAWEDRCDIWMRLWLICGSTVELCIIMIEYRQGESVCYPGDVYICYRSV